MAQCLDTKIKQFQQSFDDKRKTLIEIWLRTFGEKKCGELVERFTEHCQAFLAEVVFESLEMENRIKEEIDGLKQKVEYLRALLHIQNPIGSTIDESGSLMALKSKLECCLSDLINTIRQRKQQVKELLAEQEALCQILGEAATQTLPTETLPSSEDINKFKQHLDALRHTKMMRLQQINVLRAEISKMLKSLRNDFPMSDEEDRVLYGAHPKLNTETITTLRKTHEHCSKQIEYRKICVLYKKRSVLCDRLSELQIISSCGCEKERKNLLALLLKVEQKLGQFLQRYEDQENKPFLLDGQNIRKLMLKQYPKLNTRKNLGCEHNIQNTKSPVLENKKNTNLKKQNTASSAGGIRVPQHHSHLKSTNNLGQCAASGSNSFQKSSQSSEKCSALDSFKTVEEKNPTKNDNELENFMTGIKSSSRSTLLPKQER